MKIIVTSAVAAAIACILVVAFAPLYMPILTTRYFDEIQRFKYPKYYSWKEGKIPFSDSFFWSGFNTDRQRQSIFLGKTQKEIYETLPIVNKPEKLDPRHYLEIQYSLWVLQFDDSGKCIRVYLNKG
jgi:hypothetical protein